MGTHSEYEDHDHQMIDDQVSFNVPLVIVPHTPGMAGMKKNDCVVEELMLRSVSPTSIPSLVISPVAWAVAGTTS